MVGSSPSRMGTSFLLILIISIAFTFVGSSRTAATDAPSNPVRRALLIGINEYQTLPHLLGSINDVQLMRQVLLTRFGFEEQRITMVTDEAATRAGIISALKRFVEEAGPDDVLYLHYSGHGSQVEDLNGDEKDDGKDETLVPYDGRTENVPDIIDDEIDEILGALKTSNLLVVLDACHSGTATRNRPVRTRAVPEDTRRDLYRKLGVGTRGIVPSLPSRYVVMTGAAADQEALDGPVDGQPQGFFTYALSRSLGTAEPAATARQVFRGIERELKRIQIQYGRLSMPEPQLEAPHDYLDKPLLDVQSATKARTGDEKAARLPWVEVQYLERHRVRLVRGVVLGAIPGSVFALFPPNETAFRPGQAIALAMVTEMRGSDALAEVQEINGPVPSGARAVGLVPPPPPAKVPVYLRDMSADHRSSLEHALAQYHNEIELVNADRFARFLLDVKENTLQILSADGLQTIGMVSLAKEDWATTLARIIGQSGNAADLLVLDNQSSQLKLEVDVITDEKRLERTNRGVRPVADTRPSRYRIRRGEEPRTQGNSLQLEVRTTADAYLTVVDVDSEGSLNLLFPNEYQHADFYTDGLVRGGETVLLPDGLKPGNRAGFYWDYIPPPGLDTIRVFATTDQETTRRLRKRILSGRRTMSEGARGGMGPRYSGLNSLQGLREDLIQATTRGVRIIADVADGADPASPQSHQGNQSDWTAASVTIVVAP